MTVFGLDMFAAPKYTTLFIQSHKSLTLRACNTHWLYRNFSNLSWSPVNIMQSVPTRDYFQHNKYLPCVLHHAVTSTEQYL